MRRASIPVLNTCRWVRRRASSSSPALQGVLDEGATFADVHSVVLDPATKLPYPEEYLKKHVEKTSKEILKERNKARYGNKKKASKIIVFDHIPLEDQIACLFPGQGAQYVGMGAKVIDCPQAKDVFDKSSEILGYDILKVCLDGPKTKLDQTIYCQPALFVSSMAAFEKFKSSDVTIIDRITDAAGFSVGEFAALVVGGVLSFEDALRVVDVRAQAMHECNQLIKSGMMTVRVNASSHLDEAIIAARALSRFDFTEDEPLTHVNTHKRSNMPPVVPTRDSPQRFLNVVCKTIGYIVSLCHFEIHIAHQCATPVVDQSSAVDKKDTIKNAALQGCRTTVRNIPPDATSIIQPLDVFFPWKTL